MIRPAAEGDTPALMDQAIATGVFQPEEVGALREVFDGLHAGRLGEGHRALVVSDGPDGPPVGVVYFAPEAWADRVWQVFWIGVDPARQRRGVGTDLVRAVESVAREADGRLVLIETSSRPIFDPTRRFYEGLGYAECGRVPDFYTDGDTKIIYLKRLSGPADGPS